MMKGPRPVVWSNILRNHFVAATGEFVGTFLFLWLAFACHMTAVEQSGALPTDKNGKSSETVVIISLGYGFSLLVNAWIFYRISGGLFNPSVALGLGLIGAMPWKRVIFLIPAEILGAMAASGCTSAMIPGPISIVQTRLGPDVTIARGIFIEMFLTALLCLTVYFLAVEKSKTTFIAPLCIGLALFVTQLAGVFYTGASLNFARSLGPAIASRSFPDYFWIYTVGPLLGVFISAGFYHFLKYLSWQEANPGQDLDREADMIEKV